VKHTDSGRAVYGGDGITPDVQASAAKLTDFQTLMLARGVFYPVPQGVGDFVRFYLGTKPNVTKDFTPDDAVMTQFAKFLDQQHVTYTPAQIQANLPWLKWEIKREVATTLFGLSAGYKVELENDPQLDKAVDSLAQAKALYATARRVLADNPPANPQQ
jgi:carboxyl-terminal processing protease